MPLSFELIPHGDRGLLVAEAEVHVGLLQVRTDVRLETGVVDWMVLDRRSAVRFERTPPTFDGSGYWKRWNWIDIVLNGIVLGQPCTSSAYSPSSQCE